MFDWMVNFKPKYAKYMVRVSDLTVLETNSKVRMWIEVVKTLLENDFYSLNVYETSGRTNINILYIDGDINKRK